VFQLVFIDWYLFFQSEAGLLSIGCSPAHVASLRQWITSKFGNVSPSFTLKYKASRDGFSSANFHSRVDGVERLLVIMKSRGGYLFGGCSKVAFHSRNEYSYDSNAFLYTLVNPHSIPATMFSVQMPQYAIYGNNNYGPTYGGGHDIYFPSNVQNGGYTNFHSYKDTTGKGNLLFVGAQQLGAMDEILAFQV
jgi:hypothetical protein